MTGRTNLLSYGALVLAVLLTFVFVRTLSLNWLMAPIVLFGLLFICMLILRPDWGLLLVIPISALSASTTDITRLLPPQIQSFIFARVASGSVTLYDFIMIPIFVGGMLWYISQRRRRTLILMKSRVVRYMLIYVVVVYVVIGISALWVPFSEPLRSLIYAVRMTWTFLPLVMIIILEPLLDRTWLRRVIQLTLLSGVFVSIRALLEITSRGGLGIKGYYGTGPFLAGFASMGAGVFLTTIIGMCLGAISKPRQTNDLISYRQAIVVVILCTAAVVLSMKRAPFVGLVAVFTAFLWFNRRYIRKPLILLLLLGVIGFSISPIGHSRRMFLNKYTMGHFHRANFSRLAPSWLEELDKQWIDPNITVRFALWYQAIRGTLDYPLGIGFFRSQGSPYGLSHSHFLQVLLENGIIGFIIFVVLLVQVLKLSRSLLKSSNSFSIVIGSGVFYGFIGLIVQGIFEQSFHTWDAMQLVWFLLGTAILIRFRLDIFGRHTAKQ